jgi:queuine tRNA-ribosyltransferase
MVNRQAAVDSGGIDLPSGRITFPAFLPDGTNGVVRSVESRDLERCEIQAIQMNVFHLMQKPGSLAIRALGGLHGLCGWSRPIVTDSGGFQIFSLIRQNSKYGTIGNSGVFFRPENGKRRVHFTPERCIQLQLSYGSDIAICLDDCTHPDEPYENQKQAVDRTVDWARRCKTEFERVLEQREGSRVGTPRIFCVIQGGRHLGLRKQCAEELLEIGFDGYGYGGWPVDQSGSLLIDLLAYTRELIPQNAPMHALGVGSPDGVYSCAKIGYQMFDSTRPTKDARHGRLYVFRPGSRPNPDRQWFDYLYVNDTRHSKDRDAVSEECDCLCCTRYSRAYLHHLFRLNDGLYQRLATIHNLRFMTQLTESLRHE